MADRKKQGGADQSRFKTTLRGGLLNENCANSAPPPIHLTIRFMSPEERAARQNDLLLQLSRLKTPVS
jgi:hypothetical protein